MQNGPSISIPRLHIVSSNSKYNIVTYKSLTLRTCCNFQRPTLPVGSLKWEASRRVFRLESGRIKLVRGDSDAASSLFYILRNYGTSKTIVLN